jgi:muramidase (phage lysozyme)
LVKQAIEKAVNNKNVAAFLRVIRAGETSQSDDAYRMLFGGDLIDDLSDHPRRPIRRQLGDKTITSTAAGAYQFLSRTWDECAAALSLNDFSPGSQDLAAVFLINRRRALEDAMAGRLESAIKKCSSEWASLPGSPYGQPIKPLDDLKKVYETYGGQYHYVSTDRPSLAPGEEMPLPAFLAATIPALVDAVPKLAKLFGSGSEVSDRNLQAAEMVSNIAKEALGVKNEQELVETIKKDPDAAQNVRDAIDENWWRIDEVGGGIQAAREANFEQSAIDPKRNMALWITVLLLPLVYITVGAVLFTDDWTSETRAMVVAAVISGVLGAITGYWLGTSFSSSKKDERAFGVKR